MNMAKSMIIYYVMTQTCTQFFNYLRAQSLCVWNVINESTCHTRMRAHTHTHREHTHKHMWWFSHSWMCGSHVHQLSRTHTHTMRYDAKDTVRYDTTMMYVFHISNARTRTQTQTHPCTHNGTSIPSACHKHTRSHTSFVFSAHIPLNITYSFTYRQQHPTTCTAYWIA